MTKIENINVQKRDGRIQEFNPNKIYNGILLANGALQVNYSMNEIESITEKVITQFKIEKKLNSSLIITTKKIRKNLIDVFEQEKYFSLRDIYNKEKNKKLQKSKKLRDVNYQIEKLFQQEKSIVHENANKDSNVFNTQRDLTAGIVSKAIGLNLLPPHVANAHEKGEIHYHDLDYTPYAPMSNCCLIDFQSMFEEGFQIGNAEVESPRSIQTATAQTAQIIANVASSQYGGCSFDRIDEVLAPYAEINYQKHLKIAKNWLENSSDQKLYAKERTKKDIYDAMQSLEYEINTLFSSQGQTPFTSIGFGLGENWFEREIQKSILKVRIKGLGKEGRTAIFPKLIFTLKDGLNLKSTDPNYDIKELALKCSIKRMYPDIINYEKIVELTGSFKSPMGCRSFLQGWKNENDQEVNAGRMNLGVVTLNLPRIAIESDSNQDKFLSIFEERLEILKDALLFKVQRVMEATPENAPILYQYGAFGQRLNPMDEVKQLFLNRRATASMGYIGLYETAAVFYGNNWEKNSEAKEFTLSILKRMKEYADELSKEYDVHFSVYATPSESLTDRFCRIDTEKFGLIEDITDKGYYTNSFHYDIRKNPTPFEKIDFEKDYVPYTSGGFIHYCEYPKLTSNPKALEAVWDFAYGKVGYLGTNTPIDYCYECDFEGEFKPTEYGFKCPQCKNTNPETCDVVKRTCGYLGNPQKRPMVKGRHQEIKARVKHMEAGE